MYEALRKGATSTELYRLTHIKPWFIEQMKELVELEEEILRHKGKPLPEPLLRQAKQDGFADRYLAKLLGRHGDGDPRAAQGLRDRRGVGRGAGERRRERRLLLLDLQRRRQGAGQRPPQGDDPGRRARTGSARASSSTTAASTRPSPCATSATRRSWSTATRRPSRPTTTPPTSSTSSRSPSRTCSASTRRRSRRASSCSSAARRPLNIAAELQKAGVKILGTSVETIELAEDRDLLPQGDAEARHPHAGGGHGQRARTRRSTIAGRIGYPLIVRPSFVLGGRGHGGRPRRGEPARLRGQGGRGDPRAPDPDRPLPGRRDRERGRRDRGRRRTPSCRR